MTLGAVRAFRTISATHGLARCAIIGVWSAAMGATCNATTVAPHALCDLSELNTIKLLWRVAPEMAT